MLQNDLPYVHQVCLHLEDACTEDFLTDQDESCGIPEEADRGVVENITVKFRIPNNQNIVRTYSNQLSIGAVKRDIATKFEVWEEMLSLKQDGRELCNTCQLRETNSDEFGIHVFTMTLININQKDNNDTIYPKLDLNIYYNNCRLPDFITVHIPEGSTKDGSPKSLIVEIQNKAIIKPFLCGYRDSITGIEYLDAFSQTGPYLDKWKSPRYYSRDTQTVQLKQKLVDTMHDQASQCFLDDNNVLFVSDPCNVLVIPKKYQTFANKTRLENKLEKIKLIQRNWRRYLAVRYMKNAAKEYRQLVANRAAEEEAFKQHCLERIERNERAKQFPRSKNDFDYLYSEVHKWKIAELKRIASLYEGAARITEVNLLLDEEIQLLNGIDRQRNLVFQEMKDFQDDQLLTKMGKPITWIGYKNQVVHLDLMRTQRVRFLSEIYVALKKPLQREDRLDLLQKIKGILVSEQDFPEFPKLIALIDREKNLLIYTKHCNLEFLRKRLLMVFMDLIKFNKDHIPKKIATKLCSVCRQVKTLESFALKTRQNKVDTCKKCNSLTIISGDTSIYIAILRSIQREERKKRCNASYAFILQGDDVRYIVERIWHSHSVLSKDSTLVSLRLPRWIKSEDWSPWNCVCLTESEARDHYKLESLSDIYDHKIILEVDNHHKLARAAFHNLASVSTKFVETGQWWRAGMNE